MGRYFCLIKKMAKRLLVIVLAILWSASVAPTKAQIAPVSVLSLGVVTEEGTPSNNPAALRPSPKIEVTVLSEIPFGAHEISPAWLWVQTGFGKWNTSISFSARSFDQFKEQSGSINLAKHINEWGQVGVLVGVNRIKPGVLAAQNRIFWSLGTSLSLSEQLEAGLVASKPESSEGILNPSRFAGTLKYTPLPFLEVVSELEFSAKHSWAAKAGIWARSRFGWMSVGLETSRPLYFFGLGTRLAAWIATINVSWHPVLGISSGIMASFRPKSR